MRKKWVLIAVLAALTVLTACGNGQPATPSPSTPPAASTSPAPAQPQESPAQPAPAPSPEPAAPTPLRELSGDTSELEAALAEPSPIRYLILPVEERGISDKTAYLDRVLMEKGEPEARTLLLLVFVHDNYEIRFAMGAGFRELGLGVPEMLELVRGVYQPLKREGDPARALAALVRAINQKVSTAGG